MFPVPTLFTWLPPVLFSLVCRVRSAKYWARALDEVTGWPQAISKSNSLLATCSRLFLHLNHSRGVGTAKRHQYKGCPALSYRLF
ncbi:hypothetical protein N658DRAFT_71013 [Parathielavia hyrcaniae]|uniref:Secreted protein n=1 Tax=Parathielavia hyrcaniae TaxID=113614 RepID=A0AAN6Q5R1_9PEZI|nr:hypothetical protein N658DRAFT_71013 [Parathielavia hyrcaniae]